MRPIASIFASLIAAATLPALAHAATLGGYDYAIQYDYREFYAATDNKTFQVIVKGNPFPGTQMEDVARGLLPQMQANKPPPKLTFTYDSPKEEPHPYYRVVLVFNAAKDVGADSVCQGKARNVDGTPGLVHVFAVYCRNDQAMSQVIGWTSAGTPDDPQVGQLFKDLFAVLFDRSAGRLPQNGSSQFR